MAWGARQFVLSVTGDKRAAGSADGVTFTVQNLKQIIDLIEEKFNGRYLTTEHAMAQFSEIKGSILRNAHDIRNIVGQPLVMLLEKDNPMLAKTLSDRLSRIQATSRDSMGDV